MSDSKDTVKSEISNNQSAMPRTQNFRRTSSTPPTIPERPEGASSQPLGGPTSFTVPSPPTRKESLVLEVLRCHSEPENQRITDNLDNNEHLDITNDPDIYNQPYTFQASSMFADSFKTLHEFYKTGQLCDIEIEVGTKKIKCHKVVLSSISRYFQIMFTSHMSESHKNTVTIKDIDESVLEALVDFAYTSKIVLTTDNVQQLLYASSVLQLETVARACSEFMWTHLHPSNVIGVYQFAEQHGRTELINMANQYIFEHFEEIAHGDEFADISFDHLMTLLPSTDIRVNSECRVYEAVIQWVKHKQDERKSHLFQLLTHIKLPLLPMTYLMNNVEKESLIKRDLDCRDLLDEAKYYQLSKASLVPSTSITQRMRPRKSYAGVMFCVGGRGSTGDPFRSIEVYDIHQNRWFQIAEMQTKRRHVGVVAVEDKLYSIGGHDGTDHLSTCEVFDPVKNKWTFRAPMSTKRRGIAVSHLNGPLYVVGGLDDNTCYDVVERYDPDSDSWSFVSPLNSPRGGVAVTSFKGSLYAVGGNDGVSSLGTCERYCPHTNKWITITSMHHRRAGAGLAIQHDYLFVLGGFDDNAPLDSVERYCPNTDTWTVIGKMSCCRGGVGVAALGGLIYAVGGHDGTNYLNSVEAYDPLLNSWEAVASTVMCRAGAGVTSSPCLLEVLQEVTPFSATDCV